jgi:outer membrane protein
MSTFKRSVPFLLLSLCGFLAAQNAGAQMQAASPQTKIGVVNFQKLLEDAPQTKTAMAALETEFSPRRRELLTMQNDLKARDEKLQRDSAVMAEADRSKAEKTLRDEQREFSRKAGEFQDDASTRRNEELGKVQRYLIGEIQSYASANGFDLVLGDGVFYAKGQLDITAQVLAVLLTKPAALPAAPAAAAPTPAPATTTKPTTPGTK